MGIFGKDPEKAARQQGKVDARGQAELAKARVKAQKKKVNVEGAVAVGHTFEDSADQFLVVFPDRVEHVRRAKIGSVFGGGAGTETIPIARVSSVECQNQGLWCPVQVHTSGNSITFKADQITGPLLRQTILELVAGQGSAQPAPAPSREPDVMEQLQKLGDLHASGILSDAEFSAKKAELLNRL